MLFLCDVFIKRLSRFRATEIKLELYVYAEIEFEFFKTFTLMWYLH